MSLFLSCIFYFATKIRKTCNRKKWLNLKSLFIYWGNQFLIPADWIIENNLKSARSFTWFLNFYQTERVWIVFRSMSYPNSIKQLVQSSKWEKIGSVLTCPKLVNWTSTLKCSQQNDQFENLYISSHEEAKNIKFGQQVTSLKGFHWVLLFRW